MTMSRKHALWATIAVAAHVVIGVIHSVAHEGLGVELTRFQDIFVQSVYLGLPLLAAILVWTPLARAGALILAVSLAASLVFGVWFHFVLVSPDHVAHLPVGDQQLLFRATAVLMALINAGGAWLGLHLVRSSP